MREELPGSVRTQVRRATPPCNALVASVVVAVTCVLAFGRPVVAQAPAGDWNVTVGAAFVTFPRYQGSDEVRVLPLPLVSVEYKGRIFLGGSSDGVGGAIGVNLIRNSPFTWSVSLSGVEFRPEDAGEALVGMGDRPVTVGAATGIGYKLGVLSLSASSTVGLNNDAGIQGTFGARLNGRLGGRWFGGVGGSATFANADNMMFDFGINEEQAARRSALVDQGTVALSPADAGPFTPDAGLRQIDVNASLAYVLSFRTSLIGFVGVHRFEGDAARSPLVLQRGSFFTGLGFMYRL